MHSLRNAYIKSNSPEGKLIKQHIYLKVTKIASCECDIIAKTIIVF
jgi:hypothetical protein